MHHVAGGLSLCSLPPHHYLFVLTTSISLVKTLHPTHSCSCAWLAPETLTPLHCIHAETCPPFAAGTAVSVFSLYCCRQLGVGPVAVTSLLIGNGIRPMIPGSENIDNPSNPAPQYVDMQNIYNQKVSLKSAQVHAVASAKRGKVGDRWASGPCTKRSLSLSSWYVIYGWCVYHSASVELQAALVARQCHGNPLMERNVERGTAAINQHAQCCCAYWQMVVC